MRPAVKVTGVVLIALAFAIAHFLATIFSLMGLLYGAIGERVPGWLGSLFLVLGFPAHILIGYMGGIVSLSAGVAFGLMIANSLLWGVALAVLMGQLGRHRKGASSPSGDEGVLQRPL